MGIYKNRTSFINKKINETTDAELKKLLANGFIPESLKDEYQNYLDTTGEVKDISPDEDIDKISNANFFGVNPDKVAGKIIAGSGFLNPTITKGTMSDALGAINSMLSSKKTHKAEPVQPVQNEQPAQPSPAVQQPTKEYVSPVIKPKGEPKLKEKSQPMAKTSKEEITPTIDVTDLALIVSGKLLEDKERQVKYTVAETLKLYNKGISDAEIKAWVYHKRRFGNPMNGWEDYFIHGTGATQNILLITNKETTVKDNAYRDLRVIPANVTVGIKTKFKNTYGTEKLVICRTEQGELIWINTADVKEQKSTSQASQAEIDALVAEQALIFDGNDYYPYPVFLFGNIYDKIDLLTENVVEITKRYGKEVHDNQIAECMKFKPKLKSFRDPVKSNRPHILSLSSFATDEIKFGVTELNEEVNVKLGHTKRGRFVDAIEKISLFDAFSQWMDEAVKDTDLKSTTKANIKKYYFAKSISWPKDSVGNDELTTAQKDELIGNARISAEDLFSEFLSSALTFEDAVALDMIWNKKYNAFSNITQFVDKIPVAYDGSAMFKNGDLDIKPAQRQGLAYLQLTGSGCLAYDVGFGKTLTGILNLAQLVSQGAVKRPLVVVPKPTYKNWLKELFGYWTDGEKVSFTEFDGAIYHYGVFSGTDIKINDWYNLSGDHYKSLLKKHDGDINKLVPSGTITVVSYKGFEQMGFSKGVSTEMFDSIARVVMQKEATDDPKETAKMYEKITSWLGMGNKNSLIDIDVCGFDHLTVDEAHNFKNVFESCGKDPETGRKLFGISAGQSSRAVKMFFISNYIQLKHGKNVVLMTATPFTNSPLEIYSMLSFIGLESLNKYNLFNIKRFFEQFVLQTIEYSIDAKGEIITKAVIKSFMNLKLLQTVLYNHFHYKDDPKEANVVRPCKIDLPNPQMSTYLEMNDWQRKNQLEVKLMAKSVSRENQGAVLKAINMSLDNAFSPMLFAKIEPTSADEFIEASPKIKYVMECIRTVKEWHEERNEACSGIVIYSNRGKQYFDYIKEYLNTDIGFKKKVLYDDEYLDEVEIITGGGSEAEQDRKELVKDAFNAGVVKVIIGTSTIREGVNLQTRGTCLFDLYPEWNPTDLLQLKGRIWRQGNKYGYIRFVMPLVINSMDNFINQKLDEKSKRISSIWHSLGDSNISENTSDLDPAEIKMELVDDANEKFKIKYAGIKGDLAREGAILEENKKTLSSIENHIADLKENEEAVYGQFASKKKTWQDYLAYLKTISKKDLKDKDLKKTAESIEKAIKNTTELIEAFNRYQANRNDISLAIGLNRLMTMRTYDVFTDMSQMGRQIYSRTEDILNWRTFKNEKDWDYKYMIENYSVLKKAEKSVLNAYGKAWYDDISDIVADINSKLENIVAREEVINSTEYTDNILAEIQAEMDAKKEIRGDLDTQVGRFTSLNHVLSYLSDNTDREGCPIPTDVCCSTHGIDVIYQDKYVEPYVELEVIQVEPEPEIVDVDESIEWPEAISTLEMLLESDSENEEWIEALETLKMLVSELPPPDNDGGGSGAKMEKGGPITGEKIEYIVEYGNESKPFTDKLEAVEFAKKNFALIDYIKTVDGKVTEVGYVSIADSSYPLVAVPEEEFVYRHGGSVGKKDNNTVFTKDGVEVEKGSDKYKDHVFYDETGIGYKCLGYFPKLDDCVYINLKTKLEVIGCMDGFFWSDPTKKKKPTKSDKEYAKEVAKYKYFVVNPSTKKIEAGFEFKEDAKDLKKDMQFPSEWTVLSKQGLKLKGIESPIEAWKKMRKGGNVSDAKISQTVINKLNKILKEDNEDASEITTDNIESINYDSFPSEHYEIEYGDGDSAFFTKDVLIENLNVSNISELRLASASGNKPSEFSRGGNIGSGAHIHYPNKKWLFKITKESGNGPYANLSGILYMDEDKKRVDYSRDRDVIKKEIASGEAEMTDSKKGQALLIEYSSPEFCHGGPIYDTNEIINKAKALRN